MESMRGLELSRPTLTPPDGHVLESGEAIVDALPKSEAACNWSELQQDLLVRIFSRLELPDLIYSGAVCMPWHLSYLTIRRFRLYSPYQSPYLVYSSCDRDANTATLHNLCTNREYHFSLPDPPFRSRYVVGSSHGWLVTADEQSNLHLLNPITSAQIALPPAHTVRGVSLSFTGDGVLAGHYVNHLDLRYFPSIRDDADSDFYSPQKTRHFLYQKVILSSDPSGADCIVLLKHRPWDHLSFARIGDTKWTWIAAMGRCDGYDDFFYNADDSLFYAVRSNGEIHTIDLNGPSPVVKVILNPLMGVGCNIHYILRAPWGDLLQIRRLYGSPPPDSDDDEYVAYHQDLDPFDLGEHRSQEDQELCPLRGKLTVHRVDLAEQKVTEIKDLQGHVLFVGFNNTFMIRAEGFPNLSPNNVYVSDDNSEYICLHPFKGRQCTCVNLGDGTLTDLSFSDSLLDWPPPVWFMPRLT